MNEAGFREAGPPAGRAPESGVGWLSVGDGHRLWHDVTGHPSGWPVLILHGGPGSASSPAQRQWFDPSRWCIVQFDQRGCGQSLPAGACHANDTAHLIADIETLRRRLGIARWVVAGGSWGASLAVAYAAAHPDACMALILRALFPADAAAIRRFFGNEDGHAPAAHAALAALAGSSDGNAILAALDHGLNGNDPAAALVAVRAWHAYETARSGPGAIPVAHPSPDPRTLLTRYRVQLHYLRQQCFLGATAMTAAARRLRCPVWAAHGNHDRVCPIEHTLPLLASMPDARLSIAWGAGHDPFHPALAFVFQAQVDAVAAWLADARKRAPPHENHEGHLNTIA